MKPIAYYTLFIDSLIMIYDIEYGVDDYIIYSYKTPLKESRKYRAKIRYDQAGNAYFREKDPVLLTWCMRY